MAQFYAEIQGNRGVASRQGSRGSGIWGHIRGWNVGIRVVGDVTEEGDDVFSVWLTSGSNGYKSSKFIGTFKESDLKE